MRRQGLERPLRLHQAFDVMMQAKAVGIAARHARRRPAQMAAGAEDHPVRRQTGPGLIVFQQIPHVTAAQRQHEFVNINEGQPAAACFPLAQTMVVGRQLRGLAPGKVNDRQQTGVGQIRQRPRRGHGAAVVVEHNRLEAHGKMVQRPLAQMGRLILGDGADAGVVHRRPSGSVNFRRRAHPAGRGRNPRR